VTRARRRRLEQLAHPDPVWLARRRARATRLVVAAVALGLAHFYLLALVALLFTLPYLVAWMRGEWARGALLAEASPAPRRPAADMRLVHRRCP
jgi:hypothetical protein